MKRIAFGAVIFIVLIFSIIGVQTAKAAEVTVNYTTSGSKLSQQDAVVLKQALDVLKQALDTLGEFITVAPKPIKNASSINLTLDNLRSNLQGINTTLIAYQTSSGNNVAVNPNTNNSINNENSAQSENNLSPQEVNQQVTNQLAQAQSSFDLKSLTWPAVAVLAVIVVAALAIVLRRRMVKAKITNVKKNIQDLKEKNTPISQPKQV